MTKKTIKILALILSMLMICSFAVACTNSGNGGEEEPDATENPSANDEPATTTFIGKVSGQEIYSNIFNYFLYDALADVDFTGLEIPDEATDEEALQLRINFLQTEKEPGVTYFQDVINRTVKLCKEFKVSEILAGEANFTLTEEEITSYNESVDSTADSLLSYYGEQEGCETRDEIVYAAVGMNVNDYKRFYLSQIVVSQWIEHLQSNVFAPAAEDLLAYYNEHEDLYRTVTVRKLFVGYETEDEEGTALAESVIASNKDAALKLAENYKKILEDTGLDFGKFSAGFSDETETTNKGLADINAQSTLDSVLVAWAIEKTAASDLEILETTDGYYVVKVEGVTTYTETSPVTLSSSITADSIQASILTEYKNTMYDEYLAEQAEDARFEVTDLDNNLCVELLNKYLEETFG